MRRLTWLRNDSSVLARAVKGEGIGYYGLEYSGEESFVSTKAKRKPKRTPVGPRPGCGFKLPKA